MATQRAEFYKALTDLVAAEGRAAMGDPDRMSQLIAHLAVFTAFTVAMMARGEARQMEQIWMGVEGIIFKEASDRLTTAREAWLLFDMEKEK